MNPPAKTIRIFISSPGDVAEEREKARRVVEVLQRFFGDRVELRTLMWEDLALDVDLSAQQSIEKILLAPEKIPEVAVFILWSRLGSELSERATPRPGGGTYRSGTEHEFDLMMRVRKETGGEKPRILAYWRQDEETFLRTLREAEPSACEEILRQKDLANHFIEERFMDEKGRNVRGLVVYRNPVSFAERLHSHLSSVLGEALLSGDSLGATWLECPYRGLEVFDLEHAAIFRGREEETQAIVERLREREADAEAAVVVVVGASGAGKSSLARAGVAATLIRHSFDDRVREWRSVQAFPSSISGDLLEGLSRALASVLAFPDAGRGGISRFGALMRDDLTQACRVFGEACSEAAAKAGGPVKVILVLDQLEELWTDSRIDSGEREGFLEAVEALSLTGGLFVVPTLRSDFYSEAQRSPAFLRMKGERGQFDLVPPGPGALHRLIGEPARMAGLVFERDERSGKGLDEVILETGSGNDFRS